MHARISSGDSGSAEAAISDVRCTRFRPISPSVFLSASTKMSMMAQLEYFCLTMAILSCQRIVRSNLSSGICAGRTSALRHSARRLATEKIRGTKNCCKKSTPLAITDSSDAKSQQTAPVPCERDRSCFFVTSWSVPGTRRSARGCRWRWGRSGRRLRRW